jgi:hypothetical protein
MYNSYQQYEKLEVQQKGGVNDKLFWNVVNPGKDTLLDEIIHVFHSQALMKGLRKQYDPALKPDITQLLVRAAFAVLLKLD